MKRTYLFGPVPSRRLGRSLGIDLIPPKTCSLNCVYCECGRTTDLTVERKEYVPVKDVIRELDEYLRDGPTLDHITFSGSGEPTLNSGIGEVTHFLKERYPEYRIALLTNGTLLWDPTLRAELLDIDVIIPSLDAVSRDCFKKINRPHPSLDNERIIDGLVRLRHEFKGKILLECFVIPGVNINDEELELLREAIERISPDSVQVNSLDRPGAESWVEAPTQEELERVSRALGSLPVEVIAQFKPRYEIESYSSDTAQSILNTIGRRPCTVQDLSDTLGLHPNDVNKYIQQLLESKEIVSERGQRGVFFKLAAGNDD